MQKKHTKTAGANSNLLKRVDQRDDVVALEADVTLNVGETGVATKRGHACNGMYFVSEEHSQRDADASDLQLRLEGLLRTATHGRHVRQPACDRTRTRCSREWH